MARYQRLDDVADVIAAMSEIQCLPGMYLSVLLWANGFGVSFSSVWVGNA